MDKICVISGATSGIGEAVAYQLAERGWNLVVIGRSTEKGDILLRGLKAKHPDNSYDYFVADLSVQQEVKAAAGEIKQKYPVIDVLINNAGGVFSKFELTAEGVEKTLANNHLNYFILTGILLDNIRAADDGRIINVSSDSHYRVGINFDSFTSKKGFNIMKAYGQSKLANVMFAYSLARKLNGSSITVSVLHPGVINTPIGTKTGSTLIKYIWLFFAWLRKTGSPDDSARTYVYLADDPSATKHHGEYFQFGKVNASSDLSYDEEIQEKLWRWSEDVTAITY